MKLKTKHIWIASGALAVTFAGVIIANRLKKKKNVEQGLESPTGGGTTIIGKKVYSGAEGYVNVRNSPEVDNKNVLTFDFDDNLLGKSTASPVGTIKKQVKGNDGYFWYEIELTQPIDGKTVGYVREDIVTIK